MSMATFIEDPYRLPTNVRPTHYGITIKTDLEDLTFQGFVKVNLDIIADSAEVVLHTSCLDLGKASIYSYGLKLEQEPHSVTFDESQERVSYKFQNAFPKDSKAQLKIGFTGKLTADRTGYYRSSLEKDGKTTYYSVTQFQATSARRAFPCWDEPKLKATFAVTLISREGTVNLNNMPAISEEILELGIDSSSEISQFTFATPNERWKITKFDTTPPMSTYIVAFANGDFKYLESSVVMPLSGKTIPLRIYGTDDIIQQGQFVLDVTATVLPLYEKVFNVEYPLPKLDSLVVSDFDPAAMENWGLITGRYSVMLFDPERGDQAAKIQIAANQSHEVAHMWFGNITTLEWWTYTYLNEGFATLMGQIIVLDRAYPEWNVASQFITQYFNSAQAMDAKLTSHPIEVVIPDPRYINEVFDGLTYYKAASVLRMLAMHVGEDKFLKGVSLYLKNHLFANSVTKDLWDGITTATGIDIAVLMDNWITKMGYPVITVTETENGLEVRQDLFLESGPAARGDNETIWHVPLRILSIDDGKASIDTTSLLQEREATITFDTSKSFKLNAGTTGFFRVLYTPERLCRITAEAMKEHSGFSLDDRIGLVQDVFALAKAGYIKLSNAMSLLVQWKDEPEQLVWRVIGNNLVDLGSIWWENPQIVDHLDALRKYLFVPTVNKLGYEYSNDDSMNTSFLRTLAIEQAAAGGDKQVINELQRRFSLFIESGNDSSIAADLQPAAFIAVVEYGGREQYDAMIRIHDNPGTPSQKAAAILGMAATQDLDLIEETTRFITNNARDQDIVDFFVALGKNFKARRPLMNYFKDNYDMLFERLGAGFQMPTLIRFAISYYSSDADYVAIEAFFQDKDTSKYENSLAQNLDSIRARSEYVKRSTLDLEEWLRDSMPNEQRI